jgi:large subunit ribosomal protein L24
MKLKKGDKVEVLSGNDKGKKGEILETIPKKNKIIVKGINIRKKHVKPKKQGQEGGIIPLEVAINASKVNIVCSKCNKPTRIGITLEKEGKVRICKKCGAKIK